MSVRGTLPKLVVIATLAAAAAVAAPTAALAYGGQHQPQLPSSLSKLEAGNAAVGLVGPRINWLVASEETHG
ncbi:hypothetical protein ACGFZP_21465 [Kitasatospora sp. NPDC048239]|uniref:hypothetical protein n=1 Tax=unclassified Kitasatospora TaxID=2633591 RepID=UPI0036DABC08